MTATLERLQSAPTISSVDEQNRTLTVRCYSGAAVKRTAWDGETYDLILDPRGADLSRFNTGSAPILDSHAQQPIARQLGVVIAARESGGQIFADIRISDRPDVAGLWSDIKGGIVRNVSMGLELLAFDDQRDDSGRLITRTVTRWQPFELSFVSVGADPHATTLNHETSEVTNIMEQSTITTTPAAPAASAADLNKIREMTTKFRIDDALTAELLTGEVSLDAARARVFDAMATREEAVKTIPAVQVLTDSGDHIRNGMSDALFCRMSGSVPTEQARRYSGMSIPAMAREFLAAKGVSSLQLRSDARVVELAFAGATTSDFPNILGISANKTLLQSFQASESPLKKIARRSSARDYKLKTNVRLGEYPELLQVNEAGEFKHGSFAEAAESYRVNDFGRIVSFSRQSMVNDDLGAFADGLRMIGSAAADKEARLLIALLTGNGGVGPTMGDGKALFHTDHRNLASSGSGSALALTALDAARRAMRTQVGIDNRTVIDAKPRFLVVPASLETSAQQIVASIQPTKSSDVNVFGGLLELAVEPRFDSTNMTRWFLAADPGSVPSLEYSYLADSQGPEIFYKTGFEVDGFQIKVRLTFGCGAIDWRGLYCSPGA